MRVNLFFFKQKYYFYYYYFCFHVTNERMNIMQCMDVQSASKTGRGVYIV